MLWRLRHPSARQHTTDAGAPRGDPTGTNDLRRRYKTETDLRWRRMQTQLRSVIVTQDMLGLDISKPTSLGLALQSLPAHSLITAFQSWVDKTLERVTLEHDAVYLDPMIHVPYNRAVARGMRLTHSTIQPSDAVDAIASLQQLVVVEMQGINEAVSQRIVREAGNAILNKLMPKQLLAACIDAIDKVGIIRSRALVETFVIKAFANGTLDQFEAAGVKKVGLVPETIPNMLRKDSAFLRDAPGRGSASASGTGAGSRISRTEAPSKSTINRIRRAQARLEALSEVDILTAGDDLVCEDCDALEAGGPYTIDEARSLVPAHPWCRCAFVPSQDARFGAIPGEEDF